MSSGKAQVSDGFKKYQQKKHAAFDKARKAENTLGGIPMPIDTKFEAKFVSVKADMDDKQRPYVKMDLVVTSPEQFAGKKVGCYWLLFDSANATEADRFGWMLNELENMGLPREIRVDHEDFGDDVLGWFIKNEPTIKGRVVKDEKANDGKRIRWSKDAVEEHAASASNDMLGAPERPAVDKTAQEYSVGQKVNWNGGTWEVVEVVSDGYYNLQSPRTKKIQSEVSGADLEPVA